MKPAITVKRVYEKPSTKDGVRILVDRLWPRGIKKDDARAVWVKDLAPSTELRKWFNHSVPLWTDFEKRYKAELKKNTAVEAFIEEHRHDKQITLLYAAKDTEHNHALVLKEYLEAYFG
ncbi:MAG TPA: DUF488 family protein [Puia sp.]|jgi:uncharacterized protein YeaO (DUF488 family)